MAVQVIRALAGNIAYDLVKAGAKWLLQDPPPMGQRPRVLYSEQAGMTFHLQPDGSYKPSGVRQI